MVRTAVAGWRIAMPGMNYLDLHFLRARHGRVEIIEFKPQQHTIAMRQILVAFEVRRSYSTPPCALRQPSRR
jgi:hypothetical protein